VLYVTERCVNQLQEEGLVATEFMPGIYPLRDIVDASNGRVSIANDAHELPSALLAKAPIALAL
jgi:acyl CoA:acetate/3-ketoacid CoA transferase